MHVREGIRATSAHLNEGDELPIAVVPAAVPYFFVKLSAVCVERREIDIVREFILRAIVIGLRSSEQVAGFLGIEHNEILLLLDELEAEFYVSRMETSNDWALTEKGRLIVSVSDATRVSERECVCYVNGVTRRVEQVSGELVPRRRVPSGVAVLPAVPARSPQVEEIDIEGVRRTMAETRNSLPRVLEIARLGKVVRATRLFLSGQLLLRRGTHSVPVISVNNSVETDLARILGAHPALQGLQYGIEKRERNIHHQLSRIWPVLSNARLIEPKLVSRSLQLLVKTQDAEKSDSDGIVEEFLAQSEAMCKRASWITWIEWQILFVRAALAAKTKLVILIGAESRVFDFEDLSMLEEAVKHGVQVEIHMQVHELQQVERDSELEGKLKGVNLVPHQRMNSWSGFCCDDDFCVVGASSDCTSTMGTCNALFGAVIVGEPSLDRGLLSLAEVSQIPITVRGRRKKSTTNMQGEDS
jgi:hypothetical protein